MSLIKQLWLAILLVLVLATGGSFVLSTLSSKNYLAQQLQIKNSDNATSIAVSMSQMPKDPTTLDLLLSAEFDSGHYRYIGLRDPNGKVISERVNANSQTKAPNWFVKLIPIKVQPGIADIQDGWKQYGSIKLESDANFVIDKLWDATLLIAIWALAIGVVSCYLSGQILKRILKPLKEVVQQAKAIGESRFITIKEPKTKEFKAVVVAMNSLSNRIKKTVSEEAVRLEALQFQTNFDQISGLMNHDYFAKNINGTIGRIEHFNEGNLIISRLSNLAEIDQKLGFVETNALIKRIGDILTQVCKNNPSFICGRLSGLDFAVFCKKPMDAYAFGNQIKSELEKINRMEHTVLTAQFLHVCNKVKREDNAALLFELMHQAFDASTSNDENSLHVINQNQMTSYANDDRTKWLRLLTSALDYKRIRLEQYPVISQTGALLHYESPVRLQLTPDGKWFTAGEFISWATQLKLMNRLDELVLETAVNMLESGSQPIGLNISTSAMCNPHFFETTINIIKNNPHLAHRLYFEVPEQGVFDYLAEFRNFCSQLKALGCKVGVEHVGFRIARLGELHDMGLDYLKIDVSVIRDIDSNQANQALLRGLCMIAHSIGVMAIAEGVQTAAELDTLKQIGVDGMTGAGVRM